MGVALVALFRVLPDGVGFGDAVLVSGALGRMNAVDTSFDWSNRYNLWSGLIGGSFLALSYFGTDQSQVQRYLTGRSVAQSRLGLLVNGLVKVPMQFAILFVGAMVFAFYQFVAPPLWFNPVEARKAAEGPRGAEMAQLEAAHAEGRRSEPRRGPEARRGGEVGRRGRPRRREDLAPGGPRERRRGEGARGLAREGDRSRRAKGRTRTTSSSASSSTSSRRASSASSSRRSSRRRCPPPRPS